jgi:glutathione S-transferase
MMKLHYSPLSTYSQKAMIALYEKGVAFEPALVDLMSPEGRAAYEAIYPIGKVPLLVLDGGHMIPESTIIIEYLEGHYPNQGTKLIPEGVDAARQVRFMDRMCDLYLNNPIVTLLFNKIGFMKSDEATLQKAGKHLRHTCERLNERLEKQPWLCGEQFSMADCAAIPPLFYAAFCAPLTDYPQLMRYAERAKARPSYARVMAEFVPIWQGMMAPKA